MNAQPIHLLLLEDNPGDALLVQQALAEEAPGEFSITCVERLAKALAHIEAQPVDLVLCDLALPDSEGLASVRAIIAHSPGLPLVVLTGTHDRSVGREAIRCGAQDFLVKGHLGGDLLVRTLHHATERKRIELALVEVHASLEARVAERTAGLAMRTDRATAMLQLQDLEQDADEVAYMQKCLGLVEQLTASSISFLHFINDDQETIELAAWSSNTIAHYCAASFDAHYPISQAGVWADAFRRKAPVVINDYAACSGKRGLPEGHSRLHRLISVPVMQDGVVHALLGVGNKEDEYTAYDVETVQLLAFEIWSILCRRRVSATLHDSEMRMRAIAEQAIAGVYMVEDGRLAFVNQRFAQMFGYASADEMIGLGLMNIVAEMDRAKVSQSIRDRLEGGSLGAAYEATFQRRDGSTFVASVHGSVATQRGKRVIVGLLLDMTEKRQAEEDIRRSLLSVHKALMGSIEIVTALSEMRDPYTAGHERHVADIAAAIGLELGLDAQRVEGLRVCGLLHEVGKMQVPAEILAKPAQLSPPEMRLVYDPAVADACLRLFREKGYTIPS